MPTRLDASCSFTYFHVFTESARASFKVTHKEINNFSPRFNLFSLFSASNLHYRRLYTEAAMILQLKFIY